MQKADLIVSPQWLLTVDEQNTVLQSHSMVITGDLISDILPSSDAIANTMRHIWNYPIRLSARV